MADLYSVEVSGQLAFRFEDLDLDSAVREVISESDIEMARFTFQSELYRKLLNTGVIEMGTEIQKNIKKTIDAVGERLEMLLDITIYLNNLRAGLRFDGGEVNE